MTIHFSSFVKQTLPLLLMNEKQLKVQQLSAQLEEASEDANDTIADLNAYYRLPHYLDLNGNVGAQKSFNAYRQANDKPHEQMVFAAQNVANAHNYLTSDLFKTELFSKDIFKHTIRSIQTAFNALQSIGQQHNHGYLGDMLDDAKAKYNAYLEHKDGKSFDVPNTPTDFKSNDANNLGSTEKGKITMATESERSEYTANTKLDPTIAKSADFHHVYIKSRGKRKSVAGPYKTKEEAEANVKKHLGDGTCTGNMCENVSLDADMTLIEAEIPTKRKTFYK